MFDHEKVPGTPYPVPPTSSGRNAPTGESVAKSTVYNLAGQILPLAAAVIAFPLLIGYLGSEGFGLLAIAWMFVGYFSLFDLGLSRALTQLVARKLGSDDTDSVTGLVWTALLLSLAIGIAGTIVLALAAPFVAFIVINMPDALRGETLRMLYAIAVAIPFIVSTANLRGLLEAVHRFDVINLIRIPLGVASFAAPLLVLPFAGSLSAMVVAMVVARILGWAVYVAACLHILPWLRKGIRFERRQVRSLLTFGGWMTVSNVVSPLMVYLDRFLIGVVLTASAVAYYATPWEVVTKLLLIPAAFSAVLFPTFSYWSGRRPKQAARMYYSGVKFTLFGLLPFVVVAVVLARPGLTVWVGEEFAAHGFRPMQILALGVLFNGLATVPFACVQGFGRPDLTAKLHLLEFPIYLGVLWILLSSHGIVGAAVAWTIRVGIDMVLLSIMSRQLITVDRRQDVKVFGAIAVAVIGTIVLAVPESALFQIVLGCVILLSMGVAAWRHVIDFEERGFLVRSIGRYAPWV